MTITFEINMVSLAWVVYSPQTVLVTRVNRSKESQSQSLVHFLVINDSTEDEWCKIIS